jgi:hypothetical protein
MDSINTTNIDSLPKEGVGNSILPDNTMATNNPLQYNPSSMDRKELVPPQLINEEFMQGMNKLKGSGMTDLPSRDIPMDSSQVVLDDKTKVNYVPSTNHTDYITEHQTSDEITKQYDQKKIDKDRMDDIYAELSMPLLVFILYFMYQLPAVRRSFISVFPMCYGLSGDINLYGRLINSAIFSCFVYIAHKLISIMSY